MGHTDLNSTKMGVAGQDESHLGTSSRLLRMLCCVVSSALFLFSSFRWIMPDGTDVGSIACSPLGFLTWFSIAVLLYRNWVTKPQKRACVAAAIMATAFSIALVAGANIVNEHAVGVGYARTYVAMICVIPCVYLLMLRLFSFFISSDKLHVPEGRAFNRFGRLTIRRFMVVWGIIFACWVPMLLITWPGVYSYDVFWQTRYLLTGESIWGFHPVLHTLWISVPMQISYDLVGSYAPGVAFYSVTQMIVTSFLYAQIIRIASLWCIPRWLGNVMLVFFAIFPGFSTWATVTTKDVVFASLFGVCLAQLVDITVFDGLSRACPLRKVGAFWFALLLMLLFRKNAVYGFLLFAIASFLICRGLRGKVSVFAGALLLAYACIVGPVYGLIGVQPGRSAEAFSVPAVQLARVANLAYDELPTDQQEFIASYVPDWQSYDETIADPVKNTFRGDAVLRDPKSFIATYLRIGLEYPAVYLDAALRLSVGFWAPWYDMKGRSLFGPDGMSPFAPPDAFIIDGREAENYIVINQGPLLPEVITDAQFAISRDPIYTGREIPGVASVSQTGTWVWMFLFIAILAILQGRRDVLVCTAFIFGYWFTLMLGPVSLYRYANVVFACAPIGVALLATWHSRSSYIRQIELPERMPVP